MVLMVEMVWMVTMVLMVGLARHALWRDGWVRAELSFVPNGFKFYVLGHCCPKSPESVNLWLIISIG
jgi:hypothetical protein